MTSPLSLKHCKRKDLVKAAQVWADIQLIASKGELLPSAPDTSVGFHYASVSRRKIWTPYNRQEMHWHLFHLKVFWSLRVFIDSHTKEKLPCYPNCKIGLCCSSSLTWLVTVMKCSCLTSLENEGAFFYHICLCDRSPWTCHIYSKLYSVAYFLSLSKIQLEFLTRNTTVKVILLYSPP